MFDSNTVALIKSAPPLPGLDLNALPQQITEAYAAIVSARIRLRTAGESVSNLGIAAAVEETIVKMRRLALTLEAYIDVEPLRDNRNAAAFVAGTAHQVVLQADRLLAPEERDSKLDVEAVAPEVSATLLFLAADSIADAAEAANSITISAAENPVEAALLNAIKSLARGQLAQIHSSGIPRIPNLQGSGVERASSVLYLMLLRTLHVFAAQLLGETVDPEGWPIDQFDCSARFRETEALCIRKLDEASSSAYSTFAGPSRLSSLLAIVARSLPEAATARLPAPSPIDPTDWTELMGGIAAARPFLWRNHREAVDQGYLAPGTSAALSFPTGAGKSTLAELKIAAALLRQKSVVFLAPTLSLVDQTSQSLRKAFPKTDVQGERQQDQSTEFVQEKLSDLTVMTPERCLTTLSFNPTAFANLGLIVFDECHLLHARDGERSHRAIDAMLCILRLTDLAPDADLLLMSAMMSNASVVADWVADLTGRRCIALDLAWKPTRQVRGCVLYMASELRQIEAILSNARATSSAKTVPVAVTRRMRIQPYGLFCLHQTWLSSERGDYSLVPLLNETVSLATAARNRSWYLTPNANQVAADIASDAARLSGRLQPLKTLIFCQTIVQVQSTARTVGEKLGDAKCVFDANERRLYGLALEEMGGEEHLYTRADSSSVLQASCLTHHALLLPAERQLHESIFRRRDGINVLVATSTLAQGMNLPSEVVIIAGDSRFDSDANQVERLQAHELLNAAGRAGRAGESSHGFVLIIPSKVVHFDESSLKIHRHWKELQAIFSQSDQCLPIEDPLQPLLDRIQEEGLEAGESAIYLLRRLPADDKDDEPGVAATKLLRRSLAAFLHRRLGDESWTESRVAAALAARKVVVDSEDRHWADDVAAAAAIDVEIVRSLADRIDVEGPEDGSDVPTRRAWILAWLASKPELVVQLCRRESLDGLFGQRYKALTDAREKGEIALPIISMLLSMWMDGKPLNSLERSLVGTTAKLGVCPTARQFVLRLVPDLAYIYSLPAQIDQARRVEAGDWTEPPAALLALASCVRYGLNSLYMFGLHQAHDGKLSRLAVHALMESVSPNLLAMPQAVPMAAVMSRVRRAMRGSAL